MGILDQIADERRKVADVVDGLSPEQLATRSLCTEWTVHDIAAHLLMPLTTSAPRLFATVLASGGNFDKANIKLTARTAAMSDADIVAGLRANAGHPFKPPTLGYEAPLTDVLIHGQDIRRPLGIAYRAEDDRLRIALDFLTSPSAKKGFVPKGRLADLGIEASDLDWTSSTGATLRGPATSLMLAMAGRTVALDDLEGDGVA